MTPRCLRLLLLLLLTASPSVTSAAIDFPVLKGRVVDLAGLLNPSQEQNIAGRLAAHESATSDQIVVLTVPDLQGVTIEDYGYQLGRSWGIGQKGKDNGILLIVAQQERKVRIEVGYGLEGKLTDAIASNIVHGVILPAFRKGQFATGIDAGTGAIVTALDGKYQMRQQMARRQRRKASPVSMLFTIIMVVLMLSTRTGRRMGLFFMISGMGGGRYGGGGYGGGGGFSGGGGGFGGGGGSGGW